MYGLHYVAITHVGQIRVKNEDNFYVNGNWKKNISDNFCKMEGFVEDGELLAAVCDGMGGHACGERASMLAVEVLGAYEQRMRLGQVPKFRENDRCYVNMANDSICKEIKAENKDMGTTFSLLEFSDDKVLAVNLGDSHIYQLRKKTLRKLSTDHTLIAGLLKMNLIKLEEVDSHPMRHRITQHLGIFPDEMILEPAVTDLSKIRAADRYLICSDGLSDMVNAECISTMMQQKKVLAAIAEDFVSAALAAGGKDNITVLLVEVKKKKRDWFGKKKVNGTN